MGSSDFNKFSEFLHAGDTKDALHSSRESIERFESGLQKLRSGRMKQIFEPGDFQGCVRGNIHGTVCVAHEIANTKLKSLGIDAETPGKMKLLLIMAEDFKAAYERSKDRLSELERMNAHLEKKLDEFSDTDIARLQELERMIAEAPVGFGYQHKYGFSFHTEMEEQEGIELKCRLVKIEEIKP